MTTPTIGPTSASRPSRPDFQAAEPGHVSVLYQTVLDFLAIEPGGRYLDGTIGAGGHALGVLKASSPDGVLLGMDRDPAALAFAARRLASYSGRLELVQGSFDQMEEHASQFGLQGLNGILLDLGLSSRQLDDPQRGFSFRLEGPLDMRFDPGEQITASKLVNGLPVEELAALIGRYGEERHSYRIARAIAAARPLQTTLELATLIERVVPREGKVRGGMHPATRTFQALRIAVNQEMKALSEALPQAIRLLQKGGRLVVISFHSLEDRIVKQFFRREAQDCLCPPGIPVCTCGHRATLKVLTRKPIQPTAAEVEVNPRSRSARMRVAERL